MEGDRNDLYNSGYVHISIHALRVEGDLTYLGISNTSLQFLSTPSGWRATAKLSVVPDLPDFISIHALRVEGDQSAAAKRWKP